MAKEMVYYRKNVDYYVGVRMNPRDVIGRLLTADSPDVGVEVENLRDFKLANRLAIVGGLIIPVPEPSLEWETSNVIEDSEVEDLLKNYKKLESRLSTITSAPILEKLLDAAKQANKSVKLIKLIEDRIEIVLPDIDDPSLQQGVE